jgi:hypothetical protein
MSETAGLTAVDSSAGGRHDTYEKGVAFYLQGPPSPAFSGSGAINWAAHFAGGRMKAVIDGLGSTYSVELWLWGVMPADADRPLSPDEIAEHYAAFGMPSQTD